MTKTPLVTLTLTEDEASTLYDVLDHTSRDIEDRLPDCENDPDEMEFWKPLYDIAQRVMELIEAETTEQIIKEKPKQCPSCGNTDWQTLEQTGADAHCDHQEERNFSCSECGCRFDEVWAYSHKEITCPQEEEEDGPSAMLMHDFLNAPLKGGE